MQMGTARLPGPRRTINGFRVFSLVLAGIVVAATLAPITRVVVRLFWSDGELRLSAFREAAELPDIWSITGTTLLLVVASGLIALVIGTSFAWLNERTNARMGVLTDVLPLTPFLLPSIAGAIGWVLLLSPRAGYLNVFLRSILDNVGIELTEGPFNIYSWYGLVFVMTIYQVPFVFIFVSTGLRNLDSNLEQQAQISGAGVFRTLRRVTLPSLTPNITSAAMLMVWQGFGFFSIPAIIGEPAGIHVLSVRIVRILNYEYPPNTDVAVALSAIILFFVATIWYLQTRLLRRGRFATISGKGSHYRRIELGRWRWPVRVVITAGMVTAVILPVMALALVSLNGFWSAHPKWGSLDLDAFRKAVFDNDLTRQSLKNSLLLGVVTALVVTIAAAIISMTTAGSSKRSHRWLDGAIKLPAILSNVVIAVGFVILLSGPPFRLGGTLTILVIAYFVLYFPQGSVAADAAAAQVGGELVSAARVSGAKGGRVLRRIRLPLMLPGLVAGWALLFANMAGDLTASALLSGPSNPVVGYRILEIYTAGSYAELASIALALVGVTAVIVAVGMAMTRRRSVTSGLL